MALLITSAIFVGEGAGILADLDNDAQFLESDLVGEGDGENVEVETLEEMVDIYQSTALPLINNLINSLLLDFFTANGTMRNTDSRI